MSREITKIKINNFRQFKDIDLDLSAGKNNLYAIIGDNRFGKTNFLNSILWCLYGLDGIPSEQESSSKSHFIKNERYPNEKTSVSITLEDKVDGNVIIITREERKVSIKKKEASSKKFILIEEEDAEREIKRILPNSVKDLFLFKGEFLDNFLDEESSELLKDTIKNVSKIKRLEKISEILKDLEKEYRKTIEKQNKSNEEITYLTEKLERYDQTIETEKNRILDLTNQIKARHKEIEAIDQTLKKLNQETINELMGREKDLMTQRDEVSEKINRNKKQILHLFLEDASSWLIYEGMVDIHNKLEKLRTEGLIPPPIKPDFIKKMLEEQKCICGKPIDKDMRAELEKLIKKYPENDKLEKIYELNFFLNLDNKKFDNLYKRIKEMIGETYESESSLKIVKKKLDEITENLKGLDKEIIYKSAAQKQIFQREIEEKDAEKIEKQGKLYVIEEDRKVLQNTYQQLLSKTKTSESIANKLKQGIILREKIESLSSLILIDISKDLNSKTLQYFKEIFWENYKYIDYKISINKDFDIEIKSPEGNNMIHMLSTGERKVLALSFLAALSDSYGFDFPIVIDAPFTALQKEVMSKMLTTLINLSKRKQIIILTIPQDDAIMKNLKESANNILHMEKDREDNTSIKEDKK